MNSISKRLKYILEIKGITRYKLSKISGISETGLSRIVNNVSNPNKSTLKSISDALDVSIDWLLTGKGSMFKNEYNITYSKTDTISERLAYFKTKNGLTYYDLGSALEITAGAMHGVVRRNEVTEQQIILISEKFGITKEWFLTGEGEMPTINNKKINDRNIEELATIDYVKEDNNKILDKEINFLKDTIVSLKDTITSLKETNELLRKENTRLESENKSLKRNVIKNI